MRSYTGEYVSERGLTARVLVSDEGLRLMPPRADRSVDLVYEGRNRFTIGDRISAIEFLLDDEGTVSDFIFYPANYVAGRIVFTRK